MDGWMPEGEGKAHGAHTERHKGGWMTAAGSTKETQDLPAEASEGNSLFRCGGGGGEGK
jgi:hypothetical protein